MGAGIFAALAFLGLATGEAYMPGKGARSERVLEKNAPARYRRLVHFQLGFASLLVAVSFVRIVPVEDSFQRFQRAIQTRAENDRTPAPAWAYAFLFAFLVLIIWIGWKTMYSE